MVWLCMIPCLNLVWVWFAFPRLADSFKAYFDSVGDNSVGDCGKGLAFGFCGCWVGAVIPYIGGLILMAALIIVIIFLIKAVELKKKIPEGSA